MRGGVGVIECVLRLLVTLSLWDARGLSKQRITISVFMRTCHCQSLPANSTEAIAATRTVRADGVFFAGKEAQESRLSRIPDQQPRILFEDIMQEQLRSKALQP